MDTYVPISALIVLLLVIVLVSGLFGVAPGLLTLIAIVAAFILGMA